MNPLAKIILCITLFLPINLFARHSGIRNIVGNQKVISTVTERDLSPLSKQVLFQQKNPDQNPVFSKKENTFFTVISISRSKIKRTICSGPGEAGGGGTIISSPTENFNKSLLDLYIFQKQHPETPNLPSVKGQLLPNTRNLFWMHLDRLTNSKLPIIQIALKKLEIWGPHPPSIIQALRDALIHAPIYYTDYRIAIHDQNLWIPDDLKIPELLQSMTTIAYYAKGWGILVSKSDFESLDQLNQVALLIHEALRHVQIFYDLQISNKTLEILTAILSLGSKSLPKDVMHELQSIYDQGGGKTPEEIVNNFKGIQNDACKLIMDFPKKVQNAFSSFSQLLCSPQTIDYKISSNENRQRANDLFAAIEGLISLAVDQENALSIMKSSDLLQRKIWSEKISKLMSIRTDLDIAWLSFNIHSDQLQSALRVIQDNTLKINNFSLNAALDNQSFVLSVELLQSMDSLVEKGVLSKDASPNDN